ncbi:MAG: aspartate aminotransferase family protein [bacterium]|nr:aspartate aminotransferase family protein [bacterium]
MAETPSDRIYSGASPAQVEADLAPLVDFEAPGLALDELRNLIEERLVPHLMRYDRDGFLSMFNAFPEAGAKLGAEIATTYNQGVTNWQVSPGGAVLEELCCKALCRLFGFAPTAEGTVMYCGTYANQQAIYMALHQAAERSGVDLTRDGVMGFPGLLGPAVLTSADAHMSMRHAVRMLGLGEQSLVPIDIDSNRRMDVTHLSIVLKALKDKRPVAAVVATSGTTSTGAVDPIAAIAELCAEHGIWLHVDGAYGLAYSLVPEWQSRFAGVEKAESVSWDPHKQLGVPIPSSILFVRDGAEFYRMALHSAYFNREDTGEPNPGIRSAPTTRPMTALPLVAAIRHQGIPAMIERLRAPLAAIAALARYVEEQPDLELGHQPDTGVLCFRLVPADLAPELHDGLQDEIYRQIMRRGERSISVTQLGGTMYLRLVAIAPTTNIHAMLETVAAARIIANDWKGDR